jgi:spermidine synthase
VSVVHRPLYDDVRIKINNHYTLSGSGARVGVERAGHLPLLLHPDPKRVAFIGSATGITAGASVPHPVDHIELIELVHEVQDLAAAHFPRYNRNVYSDARAIPVVEDGRNHLRATPHDYDVVVSDLFLPWRPGVGSLYTREHFEAVRQHLSPNGLFCQWLPVFQLRETELAMILATFGEVFPNATLWRGNFSARLPRLAVIGRNGPWPDKTTIDQRIAELAASGQVDDIWVTQSEAFWMLYMGPLSALDKRLAGTPHNSDDQPRFEYLAGHSRQRDRDDFLRSGWPDLARHLAYTSQALPELGLDWPVQWRRAGILYAQADALFVREREPGRTRGSRELQRLVEELHRAAPPGVLRPDPTVAEVLP